MTYEDRAIQALHDASEAEDNKTMQFHLQRATTYATLALYEVLKRRAE
jgi:hypothetical protein